MDGRTIVDPFRAVGNTVYFDSTKPAKERINYVIIMGDHGETARLIADAVNYYRMKDTALAQARAEGKAEGVREEGEACARLVESQLTTHAAPIWVTIYTEMAAAIRARRA